MLVALDCLEVQEVLGYLVTQVSLEQLEQVVSLGQMVVLVVHVVLGEMETVEQLVHLVFQALPVAQVGYLFLISVQDKMK